MNINIRNWETSDAERLSKIANNFAIAKWLTNKYPYPYSLDDAKSFIAFATEAETPNVFAITLEDEVIGAIGIHTQDDIWSKNAELDYWIAEDYWGQGIATLAIKELVVYGFNHLNLNRIFARPFGTNIESRKALEKAGFRLEANLPKTIWKNDQWYDECIYAIRQY